MHQLRSADDELFASTLRSYALDRLMPDYQRWRTEPYPTDRIPELGSLGVLGLRIPEEYGQLAQLHRLDLHNNLLEGAIPEPLLSERMGQLSHLDLSANRLVGSIPRGLCRMTHLASLNLASNAGLLAAQRRVATCAAPCVSVCMHVPGALTPSRP